MVKFITFTVSHIITVMVKNLLHLWLIVITFMVSIIFMVVITFMGDTNKRLLSFAC